MAFPLPVTAAQVGTYFVGQYYQMLQNQPEFVHQFYSDASTMLRVDGNVRETATSMLHIHQLVTALNYTGIEIKTAHSLESWSGGVLVMVLGSVCAKNFNGKKKFSETFFLAPQEKGYFVLNDVFLYVDEDQILPHPIVYLPQSNIDAKINSSAITREQANSYMRGGDIQSPEFISPSKAQENVPVNNYDFSEEHLKKVPEKEIITDDDFAVRSNGSLQGTLNQNPEPLSSPVEEPIVETQKHTYASILQVAKGQNAHNKIANVEIPHVHENPSQPPVMPPSQVENSQVETPEEPFVVEDEGEVEVKSVYVRNVPTKMSASEIAEVFKKFGKLKQDGVAIRTRKDIDICYAFVEFEDIVGVQNAIKASTVQIGAHQLYIEERRPNRQITFRGGRGKGGVKGRFGYHTEGARGRFGGRGFGRGPNHDSYERDYYYNRSRGNGYYRQAHRHERSYNATDFQQGYEE
ncbi:Nuclear transport factor 2 (NTF2) family protein with RNA binding (RRM-RBD-RNP motifs) domain [Striga hermonthica]|uniref:Nuclear transport factor 2 (NTF2) family protein with RNA binding (RRM-RBD-RNP motifs) domain n=1 Tax=Striga hermonthica TaxID=68872 RepID=A0A9N7R8I0_STRHE|nr:Nuclear transport factor 2 (NTF2) family protein with RNA binding (RRM-RBD-RNP motifs) domain [Striga hermonthica]